MTNQPDFRKLLDEATDVLDAVPPPCGCPFCGEDPYYRSEFGEPLGIVCCEVLAWFRESDEETQEVREAVLKLLGHRGELRTALSAAVNALPAHLARIAELEAENAILKRLAPEYFRWTGGPDQTEDPEWACDKLKYGGAHFENIGTPQVRLVVYDDQDRRWVAERGDYIVKDHNGLWVLPALSGGKP
jgi:hypothetical protein